MDDDVRPGGVILYGPPASGKDTVTKALHALDERYRLFPKLKVGPGRTEGYRISTESDLARDRASGNILWENRRYNSTYAIDGQALTEMLKDNLVVMHLGQKEGVKALTSATHKQCWKVVELWCPQNVAVGRIASRSTGDDLERIKVWLETPHLDDADLFIDTSLMGPQEAALAIHNEVDRAQHPASQHTGL